MRNALVVACLAAASSSCGADGPPRRPPAAQDVAFDAHDAGVVDETSRPAGIAWFVVRVLDETTGAPVAAEARLWRLDVPADAILTAGDQVERRIALPAGHARVSDLPDGRYRLQIEHQRVGSDDPPAFEIGAQGLVLDVRVRPPRKFHVRAVVVDEDGRRLTRGQLALATVHSRNATGVAPSWAHPRKRVDGTETPQGKQLLACGNGVFDRERLRRSDVLADERGFDLGEFEEDTRETSSHHEALVEFDGRASAVVTIRGNLGQDATCYAVAPLIEAVFANVRTPEGARTDLSKATRVRADCRNTQGSTFGDGPWWTGFAVDACLQTPGYETLLFTWRVATADQKYVLKPGEPR